MIGLSFILKLTSAAKSSSCSTAFARDVLKETMLVTAPGYGNRAFNPTVMADETRRLDSHK